MINTHKISDGNLALHIEGSNLEVACEITAILKASRDFLSKGISEENGDGLLPAAIEQAFGGTEKLKAAVDKKDDAEQKMFNKILEVLFE